MPGMQRKSGKGDGSYSIGKPAKANPANAKSVMRKMSKRVYKKKS